MNGLGVADNSLPQLIGGSKQPNRLAGRANPLAVFGRQDGSSAQVDDQIAAGCRPGEGLRFEFAKSAFAGFGEDFRDRPAGLQLHPLIG